MGLDHTFLFEPGSWKASGKFTDESDNTYDIEGRSDISHGDGLWINKSWMRLRTEPPFAIENVYEVVPFRNGAMMTTWLSNNPAYGELRGTFEIEGSTITSRYSSDDQKVRGFETVTMIDARTYKGRGELYVDGALVSSWSVNLERIVTGF